MEPMSKQLFDAFYTTEVSEETIDVDAITIMGSADPFETRFEHLRKTVKEKYPLGYILRSHLNLGVNHVEGRRIFRDILIFEKYTLR